MIDKQRVEGLVEEWLADQDYFLVDVAITPDHRIVVEIDHAEGVWIDDCVSLSRFIEQNLAEEMDDYELEVGSAGLGQPFKVKQQYLNHLGKTVEAKTKDGKKWQGVLNEVDDEAIVVQVEQKMTLEGKKRPQMVKVDKRFTYEELQYTKYLIKW